MDLLKQNAKKPLPPDSPKEIEDRLRRRYLDRLGQKVKRLRKCLVERKWEDLRIECGQLAASGENFGFQKITLLAVTAQESIPPGKISRAGTPAGAKENTEALINAIDAILMEYSVSRA